MLDKFFDLKANPRFIFGMMLIFSVLSFIASFFLSVDALRLAADSDASFACDINAAISCGAVARSEQANLFGFPNAFIGMITEAIVITIALAGLGGTRFPRWFMSIAQVFYTLGLIFAYWLFYQSYMYIGALCPWCLLITVATTFVFFEITTINILQNNFYLPEKVQQKFVGLLSKGLDIFVITGLLCTMTIMILTKYGNVIFGG